MSCFRLSHTSASMIGSPVIYRVCLSRCEAASQGEEWFPPVDDTYVNLLAQTKQECGAMTDLTDKVAHVAQLVAKRYVGHASSVLMSRVWQYIRMPASCLPI